MAQNSLWALVPIFFTAMGVMWGFTLRENLSLKWPIFGTILLSFIFTILTTSLNYWYVRNMELISRIEFEFLNEKDLNSIIPKEWCKEEFPFFKFSVFLVWMLVFTLIGGIFVYYGISASKLFSPFSFITPIFYAILIGVYIIYLYNRYTKFLKKLRKIK